jgi:release factor glutamine methyltransferase
VRGERFELIVSNPPYVAEGDPHLAELRFEPRAALVAGKDGLDCIRDIVGGAPAHLVPGGGLLLEHGFGQAPAVRELLAKAGFSGITAWPDLAGILRVSGGKR